MSVFLDDDFSEYRGGEMPKVRQWMPPTWLMCVFFWVGTVLVSTGAILFIREFHEGEDTKQ